METWASLVASAPWISWTAWAYLITAAVGGAVGFVELIARYRDAPMAAVKCMSAVSYILVNAGASVLALYLLRIFGGESLFGEAGSSKQWVSEILVAGLGAMTFMRSSIFNIAIGSNQKVPVGPSVLLEVILSTADRGVDRKRAGERVNFIKSTMKGVSYEKAEQVLPQYCFSIMQNVGDKEREQIKARLEKVKSGMDLSTPSANRLQDAEHRAHLLGLALMTLVGPGVLKGAVDGLRAEIKIETGDGQQEGEATTIETAVQATKDVLMDALNLSSGKPAKKAPNKAPKKPPPATRKTVAAKKTNGKSASA